MHQMTLEEAIYCIDIGVCSECPVQCKHSDADCDAMAREIAVAAMKELISQGKRIKKENEENE